MCNIKLLDVHMYMYCFKYGSSVTVHCRHMKKRVSIRLHLGFALLAQLSQVEEPRMNSQTVYKWHG